MFIEIVKPKIALIGVGKENNFGHPSAITLENFNSIGCKVYRTDEDGELSMVTNGKGLKIDKYSK